MDINFRDWLDGNEVVVLLGVLLVYNFILRWATNTRTVPTTQTGALIHIGTSIIIFTPLYWMYMRQVDKTEETED